MTEGITGIIDQLERQKAAIERALAALREVDPSVAARAEHAAATPEAPARKRRKRSAAVRRKMALAQKARWAKAKGATEPPAAPAPQPPKPKRKISAEGMKRIIAATKKRWRLQKAATKSATVKSGGKKAAVKKSALAPALALAQTPAKSSG